MVFQIGVTFVSTKDELKSSISSWQHAMLTIVHKLDRSISAINFDLLEKS